MQKLRQLSSKIIRSSLQRFGTSCSGAVEPFKRVLILKKLTRYELEKLKYDESDDEFNKLIQQRGSNLNALLNGYKVHTRLFNELVDSFRNAGFEVGVVDSTVYDSEAVDWADLVVSAGGDGTFLVGASQITNRNKPLVGFNTNPHQSFGYLCLPCSVDSETVAKRIKNLDFQWRYRTRIEVKLTGQFNCEPEIINIHDTSRERSAQVDIRSPVTTKVLPAKALNEIFLAERRPSHVTNLIISVPGAPRTHVKCSGVCVSTGTGSTSWHMSMNRVSLSKIHRLFKLAKIECSPEKLVDITSEFNDSLQFPFDDPRMFYTLRDLIYSQITPHPSGLMAEAFTPAMSLVSKCAAASVAIDGTRAWSFNDGTLAELTTRPEIALRTLHLPLRP